MTTAVSLRSSDCELAFPDRLRTAQNAFESDYRPDIDGLRALAVLGVIAAHSGAGRYLPGGLAGVDVFFVISGYLITGIILREFQSGNFSVVGFYARRARRLFPALALMLLFTLIVGWAISLPREFGDLGRQVASGSAFMLNLVLYSDGGYRTSMFLQHLWSLGVEEQFYLVWPLFIYSALRFHSGRWFVTVVLAATLMSFAACVISAKVDPVGGFFLPTNRLWQLSLGGLVAAAQCPVTALHFNRFVPSSWVDRLLLFRGNVGTVGVAVIVGSYCMLSGLMDYPGWVAIFPVLGALLVILGGARGQVNRRVLSHPVMVKIGLISYPLYLWHFPLLIYLHLLWGGPVPVWANVGVIAGTGIISWLTYKYVEAPVRRLSRRNMCAVVLATVMAIFAVAGVLILTHKIPARPVGADVAQLEKAATEDWFSSEGRIYWTPYVEHLAVIGDGVRKTLLIGDQSMQHYYPRVEQLQGRLANSRKAVFLTRSWCPPVADLRSPMQFGGACGRFLREVDDYAQDSTVDTVVISFCWTCYFSPIQSGGKPLASGLAALERKMQSLAAGKRNAYLVLAGPQGRELDPLSMLERNFAKGQSRKVSEPVSRAAMERKVGEINARLRTIADRVGYRVIDPMEWLCSENTCPVALESGEPIFHNWINLNPSYARQHASFIDRVVSEAVEQK